MNKPTKCFMNDIYVDLRQRQEQLTSVNFVNIYEIIL